jgi:hypothetical protein
VQKEFNIMAALVFRPPVLVWLFAALSLAGCGNANTTTRFRRYIGSATTRPLLPEHDLSAPEFLLTPNARQKIQLVACGPLIQYYRDGRKIFEYHDPAPYTQGWFAFRTTQNHLILENFSIHRLIPTE